MLLLFFLGTFNFPSINWRDGTTSLTNQSEASDFIEVCLNYNLTQLVLEPTRISETSANILDLILTNYPESLSSLTYLREISDHKVIHGVFSFTPPPRDAQEDNLFI